jgi:hypothetical protein
VVLTGVSFVFIRAIIRFETVRSVAAKGVQTQDVEERLFIMRTGTNLLFNGINNVSPAEIPAVDLNFT